MILAGQRPVAGAADDVPAAVAVQVVEELEGVRAAVGDLDPLAVLQRFAARRDDPPSRTRLKISTRRRSFTLIVSGFIQAI